LLVKNIGKRKRASTAPRAGSLQAGARLKLHSVSQEIKMKSRFPGIASVAAIVITAAAIALGSTFARASKQDIVDTAVAAGQFKTLAAALTAADLVDTLKGAGPFTVFAPTDAAFAKLPAGTVENLLKPENKQKLAAILTYHVVPGAVMAGQVTKLTEAKTVNGADVKVSVHGGKVMINNADVVTADIAATNGVIHVIDAVLLPPTD
jgi:uncharacterized surface protein with fasciclin (FAS1) repeats